MEVWVIACVCAMLRPVYVVRDVCDVRAGLGVADVPPCAIRPGAEQGHDGHHLPEALHVRREVADKGVRVILRDAT